MNVTELIDALKNMPPAAELIVEGCDCCEALDAVVLSPWKDNRVLLAREEGGYIREQWEHPESSG